jgi:hypothetical protein
MVIHNISKTKKMFQKQIFLERYFLGGGCCIEFLCIETTQILEDWKDF